LENKIKVGLIGLTHPHSRMHLKTLSLMEDVGSVLLWDEDGEALAKVKAEMGEKVEGVYTDLDGMLSRDDMPVVLVVMPNDLSPECAIKAVRAGKHILCEKPVATKSADLVKVIKEAEKAKVVMSVSLPWRFHPISKEVRKLIADGILGRVMNLEARMITSQVRLRNPKMWLFKKARSGGGILSWLGCHWFDLIRFLLQDEVESVSAMVATLSGEDIDVEDTASLVMKFKKGAIGSMSAGYLLPQSIPGYSGAAYDTYLAIKGDRGNISWSPMAQDKVLRVESVSPGWASASYREFRYALPPSDAYAGVHGIEFVRAFFKAALDGGEPPNTGYDALRVLQIVEAAYESSDTGRAVKLPA